MPRKKLNNKKTEMVQVMMFPEDKAAFDAWCTANSTTMSDVIRKAITPYIVKGGELRQQEASL